MAVVTQQLILSLHFDENKSEELAVITNLLTSADLRIPDPDNPDGWLWLVMGSLAAGNPQYVKDPEMDARLAAEGGVKTRKQWDEQEWQHFQQSLREAA